MKRYTKLFEENFTNAELLDMLKGYGILRGDVLSFEEVDPNYTIVKLSPSVKKQAYKFADDFEYEIAQDSRRNIIIRVIE